MVERRHRWNHRYADKSTPPAPAWILASHADLLPASGVALDLACGLGANALFLAAQGLSTRAWDISDEAIDKLNRSAEKQGLSLLAEQRDVEERPPDPHSFDVICVSRYLHRAICPQISAALKPGGLLFYQTFTLAGRALRKKGPSRPDYLLKANELPELFPELDVLIYVDESAAVNQKAGLEGQAGMVARTPTAVST